MATRAQNAANRRNAKKSSGPRTAEGKAKSRMNALKSGLSSPGVVVLPTESQEEFEAFRDALLADLDPVGAVEEQLATEVVESSWRLRRAPNIELGVLAHGVADSEKRYLLGLKCALPAVSPDVPGAKVAEFFQDPQTVVESPNEELLEYLKGRLGEALDAKRSNEARLAAGFIEDATGPNALAKLSRYETAAFRRRNQALERLEARQAARSENA